MTRLLRVHEQGGAALTILTAIVPWPYGYGRIVRKQEQVVRIVEERDASPEQREIREINSGIYALDLAPLFDALRGIGPAGAQGERYLPDLVAIYRRGQLPVQSLVVEPPDEIRGINSRTELAEVSGIVRQSKNEELMAAGVTIEDPATTYVDVDVVVGPDTVIHPSVMLEGRTTIGGRCELHAGARIVDSTLGDDVTVNNHCVIIGSRLASGATVGPFAHLRPGNDVKAGARIGNFVELKKTVLGAGLESEPPLVSRGHRRSVRTSTSGPARSRATMTARRNIVLSSKTGCSSAVACSSSRRSRLAAAPTSPPAPP